LALRLIVFLVALRLQAQPEAEALLKTVEQAMQRGDYAVAMEKAEAAARLYEKSGNRTRLGDAENNVGVAALNKGDYAAARPHFERSIELAHEAGVMAPELRRVNNLGNVFFYQGQYVKAFETYQTALGRLVGHEKESWYAGTRKLTLTNLAVLHQQLGQQQKALDLYKEIRALPLQQKPSIEAQMLTNLAIVYRRLGDPQQALATYQQARKLLASDPNAAASLYILHNVGVVEALDFRNVDAAFKTFTEAIAIAEKSGSKRELALERLFRGETLMMMDKAEAARADFTAALADARSLHLVDELWTALYGLGRAQALTGDHLAARQSFQEAVAVIESARTSLGKTTLKAEFLAEKRDVYDALIGELLDLPSPPVAEIFRHMEEGRARNLKELLPAERRDVPIDTVRANLDAGTAVLAYWITATRLAVVWITRDASGVVQRRLTAADTVVLGDLTRALAQRESPRWLPLSETAASILLDPRLPLTKPRVVVVPDGVLHALPFEVLRAPGGQRLIEVSAISYLPSVHFLTTGKPAPPRRWPWQVSVAVFADPIPGKSTASSPFEATWPRLAYSAEEARSIAQVLPGRSRLWVGDRNHKSELFTPGGTAVPVLHFGTHGAIDTIDSRRSRLLFTPVDGDPSSPFLLTGEIERLSLSQVELVTLAACESELGRYVRGEGVENFGRLFLGAGAGATISSLWRVSDQASAELMREFYGALGRGETKAESLRQAKLTMLRAGGERAHPYFWAPYLLSGDGQTPLSPRVPWWPFIASAAVLIIGSFAVRRKITK
jgi:CHAT domain-containing protein/tetratricopeptide (TPR) repeat protein